jgi:hypothetical protein
MHTKKNIVGKKLSFSRESLRSLSAKDLGRVQGGDSGSLSCTGPDCSSACTSKCPSAHRENCPSGKGLDD